MKQSSKRIISVFLALAFIVVAFVLFFDLVQPAYSDTKTLQSQQLGEENYLQNQTMLVKQVQTTLNTYQNEAQGAANVGLAMPSGEDVAGALAQMQGIAANNNILVSSVSVTQPAIQVQTAAPSRSTLLKPLGSFMFKFSASGSYESFKNFLSELETNVRIFDVKAVSLQPAGGPVNGAHPAFSNDAFNYAVTVATYYQTQ